MSIRTLICAAMVAAFAATIPVAAPAQLFVGVSLGAPPPEIPAYTVPPAPRPNYMWTPGYWNWNGSSYYWVPGAWVAPPSMGMYWTPGYWGWNNGGYQWSQGYWGPQVGFYGGINYGAGYWGNGFYGGNWANGAFRYNTAVWPVNRTVIHNTYYDKTVINKYYYNHSRVSYNGGKGGVNAHPTKEQREQAREWSHRHMTPEQQHNQDKAEKDHNQGKQDHHNGTGNGHHDNGTPPLKGSQAQHPDNHGNKPPDNHGGSDKNAHPDAGHPDNSHPDDHSSGGDKKPPSR